MGSQGGTAVVAERQGRQIQSAIFLNPAAPGADHLPDVPVQFNDIAVTGHGMQSVNILGDEREPGEALL